MYNLDFKKGTCSQIASRVNSIIAIPSIDSTAQKHTFFLNLPHPRPIRRGENMINLASITLIPHPLKGSLCAVFLVLSQIKNKTSAQS